MFDQILALELGQLANRIPFGINDGDHESQGLPEYADRLPEALARIEDAGLVVCHDYHANCNHSCADHGLMRQGN